MCLGVVANLRIELHVQVLCQVEDSIGFRSLILESFVQ
jgi:hypothetical protein